MKFAKGAEDKARATVAMDSCVADPHENEAKCATNKRRESNWYLSEIGLLLATLTAITTERKVFATVQLGTYNTDKELY